MKPGVLKLYFSTDDINSAHKELSDKAVKVSKIKNDLYGPGSGVKWFNFQDPDHNHLFFVQK